VGDKLTGRFRCPECGGGKWGTSYCTEEHSKCMGHCHSFGCDFSWIRETEDYIYLNSQREGWIRSSKED